MLGLCDILKKHFGCENPCLNEEQRVSVDSDGNRHYEYMTAEGYQAYDHLIGLLYDLSDLDVGLDNNKVSDIVKNLDSLVDDQLWEVNSTAPEPEDAEDEPEML